MREDATRLGYNILIVSDRKASAQLMPIPALLATAAVHQHLVRNGLAHQHRTGGRDRLGARGSPFRAAGRLRRRSDPSLPGAANGRASARVAPAISTPERLGEALHQGDLQGTLQGDVEDGHLDLPVVLRRADLRGGGPRRARWSTNTSPAPRATSRASACSRLPTRHFACISSRSATIPCCVTRSTPAANISIARAARSTCGRRNRSPSCSTRRAPTTMRPTATTPS